MIPEEVVQDVLGRADIVEVVGEYVTLKKAGSSLKGLCPFHNEKTPSFQVTPQKGLFYCFGCGAGGDSVKFLMRAESLSFPETIERLAARYSIDIPRHGVDQRVVRKRREERDRMLEIVRLAQDYFRSTLGGAEGGDARRYVADRGLTAETSDVFALGLAKDGWDGLTQELGRRNADLDLAEKIGLIVKREGRGGGGFYDRFRNRLMFPVIDARGRVIAFGGRTLDPEVDAKYINSPESSIYSKGECLYGIHAARDAIRKSGQAIVVEGNVDVLMMHQFGFAETIAPMGTALTDDQARLLRRHTERVVVIFDGDKAGLRAASRALAPLMAAEIDARLVLMPDGEDPDSFLQVHGAESMRELLDADRSLAQWCVESTCQSILAEPIERRPAALPAIGELLGAFPSPVVRRHYMNEAARWLGMDPGELGRQFKPRARSRSGKTEDPPLTSFPPSGTSIPLDPIELELMRLLLDSRERLREFVEQSGMGLVWDSRVQRVLRTVWESIKENEGRTIADALEGLEDAEARDLAYKAIFREDMGEREHAESWYRGSIALLTSRWIEREIVRIGQEMADAYEREDADEIGVLSKRLKDYYAYREKSRQDRKVNWTASSD